MSLLIFLCPLAIASGFFYCLNLNRSYVSYDSEEEELSREIQETESLLTKKEKAMLGIAFSYDRQNLCRRKEILEYYLNSPAELRF